MEGLYKGDEVWIPTDRWGNLKIPWHYDDLSDGWQELSAGTRYTHKAYTSLIGLPVPTLFALSSDDSRGAYGHSIDATYARIEFSVESTYVDLSCDAFKEENRTEASNEPDFRNTTNAIYPLDAAYFDSVAEETDKATGMAPPIEDRPIPQNGTFYGYPIESYFNLSSKPTNQDIYPSLWSIGIDSFVDREDIWRANNSLRLFQGEKSPGLEPTQLIFQAMQGWEKVSSEEVRVNHVATTCRVAQRYIETLFTCE